MTRKEEAAHWFAALRRGVMTLEERGLYEEWLRRRENRKELAGMEALWDALEGAAMPAPSRSRVALKVTFAALCVLSLGLGLASSAAGESFWTGLDWTNR